MNKLHKFSLPAALIISTGLLAQTNTLPSSGNVGIGTTTPEVNLHVVGRVKIADSRNNTFIGGGNTSLTANTNPEHGRRNIAIGNLASPNLSTGSSNVSVGYEAGVNLTTGNNNFSFGSGSLFNTTTGDGNVAIGTVAMFNNVTGGENVGIGQGALNNANGYHNTAIGFGAAPLLTDGIYNTFIGNRAGDSILTGNSNTIIGSRVKLIEKGIISAQSKTLSNTVIIADGDGDIRFYSNAAGNVGIGTTTPGAYKLAVKGDAIFTKVKVTPTAATWPDYVFHNDYHLPSLKEVETFIKINKHLPGVPSAAEIEKEGLDVGGNQVTLLKKIEELTLYIIDIKKELDGQKAVTREQAAQIQEQQKLLLQVKDSLHNKTTN